MNIDQAKELQQTILWEEFCKEVDKKVIYQTSLLEKCKAEDLVAIQQNISVLRSVKNIPQDVIDRES